VNGRVLGLLAGFRVPRATQAMAWSDLGYRIICEIAFQELDESTREHPTEQLYAQGL
jgi:hypothetical protein